MKKMMLTVMAAALLVAFSAPSFAGDDKKKEEKKGGHFSQTLFGEEKKKEEKKGGHLSQTVFGEYRLLVALRSFFRPEWFHPRFSQWPRGEAFPPLPGLHPDPDFACRSSGPSQDRCG